MNRLTNHKQQKVNICWEGAEDLEASRTNQSLNTSEITKKVKFEKALAPA